AIDDEHSRRAAARSRDDDVLELEVAVGEPPFVQCREAVQNAPQKEASLLEMHGSIAPDAGGKGLARAVVVGEVIGANLREMAGDQVLRERGMPHAADHAAHREETMEGPSVTGGIAPQDFEDDVASGVARAVHDACGAFADALANHEWTG